MSNTSPTSDGVSNKDKYVDYMEIVTTPPFLNGIELTQEQGEKISALNEQINAYCSVDNTLSQAEKALDIIARTAKELFSHFPTLHKEIVDYITKRVTTLGNNQFKVELIERLLGLYVKSEGSPKIEQEAVAQEVKNVLD